MALVSLVPFQGPNKSRFSGPTPSHAPRNDVAPLKTITYRAIKTTGTLLVIFLPELGVDARLALESDELDWKVSFVSGWRREGRRSER
jgi:hypothetical protein